MEKGLGLEKINLTSASRAPFVALLILPPWHKAVLELAAEKANWTKPPEEGVGRGITLHESFGSIVAQVAEVSVNPAGKVRVHKVVCAIDCGTVVNPEIVNT